MSNMKFTLTVLLGWCLPLILLAQNTGTINGKVTTTDGKQAPSVNVSIKELKKSAITDEDGTFSIDNIKPGSFTIVVSHTGLQTQQQTVTVSGGATMQLTFTLKETLKQLDAVVVSGRRTLNEKKVTLGKAGLNPMDNPQTMGVVSSVVIADQQANRLGDVVKNVSGVSLTQQRQGVAETFSARGYSIGIGGGSGSIFKNGIVTNTGGYPEASTLESVEVLKGSTALLYGNTSGGVIINMVTKKPKFDWGGEVTMRAGSYDLYKPIIDVYGPLSRNVAFRVVGTYENSRSYRDIVKNRRTYVNPSLLYKIGKKTSLLLQGDYMDANFTPDNGIGIVNQNQNVIIPASRSRFINTPWAYYKTKQHSATVNLDHNFNDHLKLNFIGGVTAVDIKSYGTNVPSAVATNGDWVRTLSRTHTSEDDYTAQLNLNAKVKTGFLQHQVLFGADYVKVIANSDLIGIVTNTGTYRSAYDTINILDPTKRIARTDMPNSLDTGHTRTPSYRTGVYVQDLISLTNKIKVLAGIRWSYLENQPAITTLYLRNTERVGAKAVNRAWSPKVALLYEPFKTTTIWASYSNNFTVNTGTDIYGNALSPSYIDQYEVGIKNLFFDGKISANVSVYRIKNSNLAQTAIFDRDGNPNTNTTLRELTGGTQSDGFEIDVNGSFARNFYFIAGYANNYARYTNSTGKAGSIVVGEELTSNPRNTVNSSIFYTLPTTALKGLKLGASGFYTGTRWGGNQNTVGQTPQYERRVPLSDFTTIDLSAGYTYRQFSLLAKLSNITNTLNYLVHDRYSINPIAPRQLIASLSYKF